MFKEIQKILSKKETRDRFINIINEVPATEREKKVIVYRLGLEDGAIHTLEETGKMFGVTRERIRQIEAKMFEKIRAFYVFPQDD